MAKRKVEGPGVPDGEASSKSLKLTYKEERFVDAYIRNGGNATEAYYTANPGCAANPDSARVIACRWLTRVNESGALQRERDRITNVLKFTREDALRIYVAMATATLDDFAEVLKKPDTLESYNGLGDKRYALQSAKKSHKNGNEVKLYDRKAAVDALWERLGFGKETGGRDRLATLTDLLGLARSAGGKGSTG